MSLDDEIVISIYYFLYLSQIQFCSCSFSLRLPVRCLCPLPVTLQCLPLVPVHYSVPLTLNLAIDLLNQWSVNTSGMDSVRGDALKAIVWLG